jgi:hypothetical protein
MTGKELKDLIRSWKNLSLIVDYMCEHPDDLDLLVKLALGDSQPRNYRAVWMVEKIHDKHPEFVLPYLPSMTDFVLQTKNSGKKRHLLKLISLHPIQDEKIGTMLEFCLRTFTNAEEEIAVRVHAMQILCNIAESEPDLIGELIDVIENEIEYHGSAGIASRGRKLLAKLYKMKNNKKNRYL